MRAIDKDHPNFRSARDALATPTIPSDVGEVDEESSESITSSGMPVLLNPSDVVGEQLVIDDQSGGNVRASVLSYNPANDLCCILLEDSGEEQAGKNI